MMVERETSWDPILAAAEALAEETGAGNRLHAAGLLAALAEDRGFLAPVQAFQRSLLDRMTVNLPDPGIPIIIFLALHGMRSMELFDAEVLTDGETGQVVSRMRDLVGSVGG